VVSGRGDEDVSFGFIHVCSEKHAEFRPLHGSWISVAQSATSSVLLLGLSNEERKDCALWYSWSAKVRSGLGVRKSSSNWLAHRIDTCTSEESFRAQRRLRRQFANPWSCVTKGQNRQGRWSQIAMLKYPLWLLLSRQGSQQVPCQRSSALQLFQTAR